MTKDKSVTAVDWYAIKDTELTIKYLKNKINATELLSEKAKCLDQANKMFKEQIKNAYQSDRFPCSEEDAEQYYNETYKQQ